VTEEKVKNFVAVLSLKSIATILLLIAFALPTGVKLGILIHFGINRDLIAKTLCIKREEPMSTCKGSCFLSKKLKEAEQKQESNLPQFPQEKVDLMTVGPQFIQLYENGQVEPILHFSKLPRLTENVLWYLQRIEHPPEIIFSPVS
jgi:hypothetical protein